MKQLWRGLFNLNTEVRKEYAYAHSPRQAYLVMARRIAKKQGVLPAVVLGYLKEHPEQYKIEIEQEFKETA